MFKIEIIQHGKSLGIIRIDPENYEDWLTHVEHFADSLKIYDELETGYYEAILYNNQGKPDFVCEQTILVA